MGTGAGRTRRVAVVVGVVAMLAATPVASARAEWVDPDDAAAVRRLYDDVWRRPDPPVGWTGSVTPCAAGTIDRNFVEQTFERINAYRSLAGVGGSVTEDPAMSAAAQDAALIMKAANALSHYPDPSWPCYTANGALGAGSSNLYFGRSGVDAIDGYIVDPGGNNRRVGHRWWILRPGTERMGVGATDRTHALWVTTTNWNTWTVRDPRGIIAWPPAGHLPAPLVPPRWSVMTDDVDLSAATVTVTDESGAAVPLTIEALEPDRVVFVPAHPAIGARRQLTSDGSTAFTVRVTAPGTFIEYVVRILDVDLGNYTPVTPRRLVDTRSDLGLAEMVGGATHIIDIRQLGGLPRTATAVVANVTVTSPRRDGFLSVTDCSNVGAPGTSSLNFAAGETRANLVAVPMDASGRICATSTVGTEFIVDLAGYHSSSGDGYVPLSPSRIVDTRNTAQRVQPDQPLVVQITGNGGVPAGATSVTMNLTATGPLATGFLTAWPCDSTLPVVSNVNYVAGQSVPNLATVRLDPAGRVCIHAEAATHVIVDVAGYTAPGGRPFAPLSPSRIVDTRSTAQRVQPDQPLVVQVTGNGGVPAGATSVTMNLTATGPLATGFLTAWPCDSTLPVVSNVNYVAGQSVPNLATVRLDPAGRVCIHAEAATHVIVDVAGYTLE